MATPLISRKCRSRVFDLIRQDANEFKQRVDSKTDATAIVLDPGESHNFPPS
jgi:hypothetical protein